MNLRVRGPNGQATLSGVEQDMTVEAFQQLLADKTGVPPQAQEVLGGFPPRPLQLPADKQSATVASLGLQAGDSLTVRQGASAAAAPASSPPAAEASPAAAATNGHFSVPGMSEDEQLARAIAASLGESSPAAAAPAAAAPPRPAPAPPAKSQAKGSDGMEPLPDGRAVVRRVVADDNSCLFSAVGYVMRGTRSAAAELRSVVASAVAADPVEFNEAVLGRDPGEYCKWITDPRRWGGAIELSILSRRFGKEIAAFDIQTQRVDTYGQDAGYSERVMLLYDGLHYDALAVAARPGGPESSDTTTFPVTGFKTEEVMEAAARLVARAHHARQFTDTATFTLRCGVCKLGLKGEKEALQHASSTGHTSFAEY